jgi:tripeptide aminopeptidase
MEVRFHGRASHSGMYPEEGRSAIAAAAKAIADFKLGRIDEESSANVGIIKGGTAGNIVPEWCSFLAEARSHDPQKLADLVREMLEAVTFAAGLEDCQVETEVHKSYSGYRFKRDDFVVSLARTALERIGYEPSFTLSGGAADANVFNDRGLHCVNLANGIALVETARETDAS